MRGALSVELAEFGVAPVTAQLRGELGVAPPGEPGDGGAPAVGGAGQLRGQEHPLDACPALLQRPGRRHGERGARGVTPQHHPGQAPSGDLRDDPGHHRSQRRERLGAGGQVVAGQLDRVDRDPAARNARARDWKFTALPPA